MTKPELDSLLKALNSRMGWATIAVAIGIFGEYISHFVFTKEKKSRGEWICTILFAILVLGGVGGEYWYGEKVSETARQLQEVSDAEVASANAAAESAKTTAKGFEAQIADSSARIKASEADSKKAEARAAEARSMAESERLERIQLEARGSPRSFDSTQLVAIRDSLRTFRNHPAVRVTSYGQDGEAAALGSQIVAILASATGVQPKDERASFSVTGGFEYGVQIRGPASENAFMSALATAFTNIGRLTAVVVNGATFRPGVIESGNTMRGGRNTISGGGGVVIPPIPTTGPVVIHVGVKPVPVVILR